MKKRNKFFYFIFLPLFFSSLVISNINEGNRSKFKLTCEQELSSLNVENLDLNCDELEVKQKLLILAIHEDYENRDISLCNMKDHHAILKILSFEYEDPKENALAEYKVKKCLGMNGLESYKTKLKSIKDSYYNYILWLVAPL